MFRSQLFRRYFSALLLLLLGRVLAPESLVLVMHTHAHTQDEPAHAPAIASKGKALLSPKHQHCHVDQLYDVPALPAAPVVVPLPVSRVVFAIRVVPPVPGLPAVACCEPAGRGPPRT